MLELYYGRAPDAALMKGYTAMKCASLLRETLWGMVSEITSQIDFDHGAYAEDYLARFERAAAERRKMPP